MVRAFDYLPKRVQKKKKVVAIPEIHVHFPAHFGVGESSSTPVRNAPEVVFDADQEAGEPSFYVFKTEVEYPDWEY
jgi:hypothetical protein